MFTQELTKTQEDILGVLRKMSKLGCDEEGLNFDVFRCGTQPPYPEYRTMFVNSIYDGPQYRFLVLKHTDELLSQVK